MLFGTVDSGGPKEPCIRWGPDPHTRSGNIKGEKEPAKDMPGHVRGFHSAGGSTGTARMLLALYSTCCTLAQPGKYVFEPSVYGGDAALRQITLSTY